MNTPYETSIPFRRDVIWKALRQMNGVKDPIKFHKDARKKYGEIYADVFGFVYEFFGTGCYAVVIDKVDTAVCQKYGWKTMLQKHEDEFAALRKEIL